MARKIPSEFDIILHRLDNIDARICSIHEDLTEMKILDAEQNLLLEQHSQRSDELKKENISNKDITEKAMLKLEMEIEALESPIKFAKNLASSLSWIIGTAASIATIVHILKFLGKI